MRTKTRILRWPSIFEIPEISVHAYLTKLLIFLLIITGWVSANAQAIESSSHCVAGWVEKDGTIKNSTTAIVGYFKSDTIETSSHGILGFMKPDGTIEDENHKVVGYLMPSGNIDNKDHLTVGYINKECTVENGAHSIIGYAKGVKKEWIAVVFFFIKFM